MSFSTCMDCLDIARPNILRTKRRKKRHRGVTSEDLVKQDNNDFLIRFTQYFGVSKSDSLFLNQRLPLILSKVSDFESMVRTKHKNSSLTKGEAESILISSELNEILEKGGKDPLRFFNEVNSVPFEAWLRYIISELRSIYCVQYLTKKYRRQVQAPSDVSHGRTSYLSPEEPLPAHQSSRLASSEHSLPPLRVTPAKSKFTLKRLFTDAGFDESFGRATPRCLRAGEGQFTIADLRKELKIAEASLTHLTTLVDGNIAWVQQNCSSVSIKGKVSSYARTKCQDIAIKKFVAAVEGFLSSTRLWALLRWQSSVRQLKMSQTSISFLKAKSLEIVIRVSIAALRRQYLRAFKPWRVGVRTSIRRERHAAAIQIQRTARGFMHRRMAMRLVQRNSEEMRKKIVQLMAETAKAQQRVFEANRKRLRDEKIHNDRAALDRTERDIRVIQSYYRKRLAVKRAKDQLERLRRSKAEEEIRRINRERLVWLENQELERQLKNQDQMRRSSLVQTFVWNVIQRAFDKVCDTIPSVNKSFHTPKVAEVLSKEPIDEDRGILKGIVGMQNLFRRKKAVAQYRYERERAEKLRSKKNVQKKAKEGIGIVINADATDAVVKIQSIVRGKIARSTKDALQEKHMIAQERFFSKRRSINIMKTAPKSLATGQQHQVEDVAGQKIYSGLQKNQNEPDSGFIMSLTSDPHTAMTRKATKAEDIYGGQAKVLEKVQDLGGSMPQQDLKLPAESKESESAKPISHPHLALEIHRRETVEKSTSKRIDMKNRLSRDGAVSKSISRESVMSKSSSHEAGSEVSLGNRRKITKSTAREPQTTSKIPNSDTKVKNMKNTRASKRTDSDDVAAVKSSSEEVLTEVAFAPDTRNPSSGTLVNLDEVDSSKRDHDIGPSRVDSTGDENSDGHNHQNNLRSPISIAPSRHNQGTTKKRKSIVEKFHQDKGEGGSRTLNFTGLHTTSMQKRGARAAPTRHSLKVENSTVDTVIPTTKPRKPSRIAVRRKKSVLINQLSGKSDQPEENLDLQLVSSDSCGDVKHSHISLPDSSGAALGSVPIYAGFEESETCIEESISIEKDLLANEKDKHVAAAKIQSMMKKGVTRSPKSSARRTKLLSSQKREHSPIHDNHVRSSPNELNDVASDQFNRSAEQNLMESNVIDQITDVKDKYSFTSNEDTLKVTKVQSLVRGRRARARFAAMNSSDRKSKDKQSGCKEYFLSKSDSEQEGKSPRILSSSREEKAAVRIQSLARGHRVRYCRKDNQPSIADATFSTGFNSSTNDDFTTASSDAREGLSSASLTEDSSLVSARMKAISVARKRRDLMLQMPSGPDVDSSNPSTVVEGKKVNERGFIAIQSHYRRKKAKEVIRRKRDTTVQVTSLHSNFQPASSKLPNNDDEAIQRGITFAQALFRGNRIRNTSNRMKINDRNLFFGGSHHNVIAPNKNEETRCVSEILAELVTLIVERDSALPEVSVVEAPPLIGDDQSELTGDFSLRRREIITHNATNEASAIYHHVELSSAACLLQRFFRGLVSHKIVGRRRSEVKRMQIKVRALLEWAVVNIQRYVRGDIARKRFKARLKVRQV